jgi:uncharacterized phiE125 gp8 family phage protein
LDIEDEQEDDDIESLITSAREAAEKHCKRAFITQQWDMILDEFEAEMEIPLGKLQTIDEIYSRDLEYVESEVASTAYFVDTISDPGIVLFKRSYSPPVTARKSGWRIQFTCGYGDAATDLPKTLITAIKRIAAYWYENREAHELPKNAKDLLDDYCILYI